MLVIVLIGLLVGVTGFALVHVVSSSKFGKTFTLPALIIHVALGTMLQFSFGEKGTLYLLAWMLANTIAVSIGFYRRSMRRKSS